MDYNDQLSPALNMVASLQEQPMSQFPTTTQFAQSDLAKQLQNYPQQDVVQAQQFNNYQANPSRFQQPTYQSDLQRSSVMQVVDLMNQPQQQQQRLAQYQLPQQGQAPQLSPLATQEVARQGVTPMAYLLRKRLQATGNEFTTDSSEPQNTWIDSTKGVVDPTALLHHPQFVATMQQNPQKASQVFQALTGEDLGQTMAANTAQSRQRFSDAHSYITEGLKTGRFQIDPKTGAVQSKKMVYNPVNGQTALAQDFTSLDPMEQQHFQVAGHAVMPGIAAQQDQSRSTLLAQKQTAQQQAAQAAQLAAKYAGQGRNYGNEIATLQTARNQQLGTNANSAISDASNTFGNMIVPWGGPFNTTEKQQPTGQNPIHAASKLRGNSQWQALFKKDPIAATRILMSMQVGPLSSVGNQQSAQQSSLPETQDSFGIY